MKYLAKTKTRVVTDNTIITPEDFGGWCAQNWGNVVATINGVRILPQNYGGALQLLDFTHIAPDVVWGEDITVIFDAHTDADNPKVVLTFIKYTEI